MGCVVPVKVVLAGDLGVDCEARKWVVVPVEEVIAAGLAFVLEESGVVSFLCGYNQKLW